MHTEQPSGQDTPLMTADSVTEVLVGIALDILAVIGLCGKSVMF